MEANELLQLLRSLFQVTVVVQPSEVMSYDEAAKMLGVNKSFLQRHTEIPRYQPSQNLVYFRRSDLESFVFTQRMISKDDFLRKMGDVVLSAGRSNVPGSAGLNLEQGEGKGLHVSADGRIGGNHKSADGRMSGDTEAVEELLPTPGEA